MVFLYRTYYLNNKYNGSIHFLTKKTPFDALTKNAIMYAIETVRSICFGCINTLPPEGESEIFV